MHKKTIKKHFSNCFMIRRTSNITTIRSQNKDFSVNFKAVLRMHICVSNWKSLKLHATCTLKLCQRCACADTTWCVEQRCPWRQQHWFTAMQFTKWAFCFSMDEIVRHVCTSRKFQNSSIARMLMAKLCASLLPGLCNYCCDDVLKIFLAAKKPTYK